MFEQFTRSSCDVKTLEELHNLDVRKVKKHIIPASDCDGSLNNWKYKMHTYKENYYLNDFQLFCHNEDWIINEW